jgi:hypothetical protein
VSPTRGGLAVRSTVHVRMIEDDHDWFASGRGPGDIPTRPLSPEEVEVVFRLASQYSDLRLVELDLHELARLRGHAASPPMGAGYRPAELFERAGPDPRAAAAHGRGESGHWTAERSVRLVWSFLWRWGGLAGSLMFLPSVAEIRAAQGTRFTMLLGGAAAVLVLLVLGLIGRWWRMGGLLGSLFRLLLGAVVVNLAFLLSTGAVFVAFLASLIVMTWDALAAFLRWRRSTGPRFTRG